MFIEDVTRILYLVLKVKQGS